MWADNDTGHDFLNFEGVAYTVAEIVFQANGGPISIGVSGAWGTGKSSMIRLTKAQLELRAGVEHRNVVFVDFNAWLYQGYDDARSALVDVIATKLAEEAERRQTGQEKAKDLLLRVEWMRALKLGAAIGSAFAGVPPVGLIGEGFKLAQQLFSPKHGGAREEAGEGTGSPEGEEDTHELLGLLKKRKLSSPPKEIQLLRQSFEDTIHALGITLVVLIDDLDRCLPATTISTLEAIRLFLFLDGTAFVIAADDEMIKGAVSKHFDGIKSDIAMNYFDKLIQVPIKVPALGIQEVRAYMLLLFVDEAIADRGEVERIRTAVCAQLKKTWSGARVDRDFVSRLIHEMPIGLSSRLEAADRLAHLMTTASNIRGNPRLIKRFLNALWIRKTIAMAQGVAIDEAVLIKLLLFERCGNLKAYEELVKAVAQDTNGKPSFLADWEGAVTTGGRPTLEAPWDSEFVGEWLTLPPQLADKDLRGALYVSREFAPLVFPRDRLSSEAVGLLEALLTHPAVAEAQLPQIAALPKTETPILMDRLLERAQQESEWGAPEILNACLAVADVDPSQALRLSAFLGERPAGQIKPNLIPKIGGRQWAEGLWQELERGAISAPVRAAIRQQRER